MDKAEKRIGFCSNCGKELEVPVDLPKFACMYCGTVMTQDMLLSAPAVSEPEPERPADELYAEVITEIPTFLVEHMDYMNRFSRKEYYEAFDEMSAYYQPVFEKLNVCYKTAGESVISGAVDAVMNALDKAIGSAKKPAMAADSYKMVIALFFSPAIKHFGLSVCDPFAEAFHTAWLTKNPKNIYKVGTYEEISAGFRKKFLGLCFITTAVCEYSGKPDDCYELTAFRGFRDGYLASSEGGMALIDEYYETAPIIVTCIDLLGDRDTVYPMLREKYLAPCLDDIENGRYEACKARYVDMVRSLQKKYLPQ